jgi:hypothetical protein
MYLYKLLKSLLTVLKVGKIALFKGLARVTTLFSSNLGLWGWIVLASILVFDHQTAIRTALETGSVRPIVVSYGVSLGSSIQIFITALEQVPQASGMEYAEVLWKGVSSAATVLWYFKALFIVTNWIETDVSPQFFLLFSSVIYLLVVFAVTGWLPDAGTVEAFSNVGELFDLERLNPLLSQENASNITNSTVVDPVNTTLD